MPQNSCIMQIWAESGKSALPICNYSQILYQFLMFTQNLKRSQKLTHFILHSHKKGIRYPPCSFRIMNSISSLSVPLSFHPHFFCSSRKGSFFSDFARCFSLLLLINFFCQEWILTLHVAVLWYPFFCIYENNNMFLFIISRSENIPSTHQCGGRSFYTFSSEYLSVLPHSGMVEKTSLSLQEYFLQANPFFWIYL